MKRLFMLRSKDIRLSRKKIAYAFVALLVVGVAAWIIAHRGKSEPQLPVIATVPVNRQDVNIYGEYVGRIRAQQFVEIRARVEGFLEEMLFEEGTYVTKNQVLFCTGRRNTTMPWLPTRAQWPRWP